ncbi:MAG: alpha/beta fold hydrolase [Bacteroidales bacterium]
MELFYHTYGGGQPLIILHGLFGLSDNWVTIAKRIAANYKVYIPDQRNHGQSPHDNTFNYYALADDLMEFMEQHNIQKPVLMGHSMGGKVAMNFALDYPENVDKLIVVDMSVRQYKARPIHYHLIEAMESVDFNKARSRKDVEEQLAQSIPQKPLRLFIMKNLKRYSGNLFGWKLNLPVLKENLDTIVEGLSGNQQFDKPSLFVGGGKSDYIQKEDYELIPKIFPQATIKMIPEATHWLHADSPEQFCNIVSEFLNKYCKSADDLLSET